MKKTKKKTDKLKTDAITFRPDMDVEEMLRSAIAATGARKTDLIIEALRESLPSVVRKMLTERKQAEETFLRRHPDQGEP